MIIAAEKINLIMYLKSDEKKRKTEKKKEEWNKMKEEEAKI